jgi:hypothetical protein
VTLPGPDQIRAAVALLEPTERKVLGGMIVLMIRNHDKIKDREWVAENFTRLSVGALGLEEDRAVDEDIATVNTFIETSMGPVLNAAFPLFSQVATDMQARTGAQGFTLEDACAQALSYF